MKEIEKITSRDNRRIVNARKVRDGKATDQIFIEGKRLVAEALQSRLLIDECFVVEGFRDRELLDGVANRTKEIVEVSEKIFRTIADTDHPQGIILIAQRPKTSVEMIAARLQTVGLPLILFLHEINNPSNLGAILRTAEAADAAGIIVSENSADIFSPKAIRSAMGASFRIAIWENANFDAVLKWVKGVNLAVTAADASASESYLGTDWKIPRLVIFGSEAHGLGERELSRVDHRVRIPLDNSVESLNLAVSAGIILFEARRQNAGDRLTASQN